MSLSMDMVKLIEKFEPYLETVGEDDDEPEVRLREDAPESAKKAYAQYERMIELAKKQGIKI